jgi:hypothetical protein
MTKHIIKKQALLHACFFSKIGHVRLVEGNGDEPFFDLYLMSFGL